VSDYGLRQAFLCVLLKLTYIMMYLNYRTHLYDVNTSDLEIRKTASLLSEWSSNIADVVRPICQRLHLRVRFGPRHTCAPVCNIIRFAVGFSKHSPQAMLSLLVMRDLAN
jgi:hypothetical protein